MQNLVHKYNTRYRHLTPYQITRNTAFILAATYVALKLLRSMQAHGARGTLLRILYYFVKYTPGSKQIIATQTQAVMESLEKEIIPKETRDEPKFLEIPTEGVQREKLMQMLTKWKEIEEKKWKKGQASGCVYHGEKELLAITANAYCLFALSNPLHPTIFPFVRKMEAETVAMTINLFNGSLARRKVTDEKSLRLLDSAGDTTKVNKKLFEAEVSQNVADVSECCGAMTSGGTESILMAMKTYRDIAYAQGNYEPEIIAATTAHAAFNKAADYFRLKLVHVNVDENFAMDIAETERAITKNTIVLVGSAPSFPQGILDPIEKLSDLAIKYSIYLHVDSCLGGFLLPFLSKLSRPIILPKFDFTLPGVTSISADTHKYGYAPKGSSVIMYRNKGLRSHQYFVAADWTGGIYGSPAMPGSRSGGIIASTWTALMSMGINGYVNCAQAIMDTVGSIRAAIEKMEEIKILGNPCMSVIAFANNPNHSLGKNLNIYQVGEAMTSRGWSLNPLQNPPSIHICVTYVHRKHWERFVGDLRASIDQVISHPEQFKSGTAAIYGLASSLPETALVEELTKGFIDTLYKA